jgi:hypothetical protein
MYVNGKMIPVETIPGMGQRGRKRECWKGWIQVWLYLIYYNNFCKCHNVPPPSTAIKINKILSEKSNCFMVKLIFSVESLEITKTCLMNGERMDKCPLEFIIYN